MIVPSGRYASPSAWKPGCGGEAQVDQDLGLGPLDTGPVRGTSPVTWIHSVLHGRPHGMPAWIGSYCLVTASANGTGSPGTGHASRVSGTEARWTARVR